MSKFLIVCHDCDTLHQYLPLNAGNKAYCHTCNGLLYRSTSNTLNRAIALYSSALLLIVIANSLPFMTLELAGKVQQNYLFSSGWALYEQGMGELGLLIFTTSILFPLVSILGLLYLLICLKLGVKAPAKAFVYRTIKHLKPWNLTGVFMLGVLIALVKLLDMANIIIGSALFAFMGLLIIMLAAEYHTDKYLIWPISPLNTMIQKTAKLYPSTLLHCHVCGKIEHSASSCPQCKSTLFHRKQDSVNRTFALLLTASMFLIPANMYPIMTVIQLGQGEPNTIISGVVHLIEAGMWPLGLLVFFASIIIPCVKILVIGFLAYSVKASVKWQPKHRTQLYRVTEIFGAWSMVDIYIIGILSALVNLGSLATIEANIGATFFALAVISTLMASHSFDSRLIWDQLEKN